MAVNGLSQRRAMIRLSRQPKKRPRSDPSQKSTLNRSTRTPWSERDGSVCTKRWSLISSLLARLCGTSNWLWWWTEDGDRFSVVTLRTKVCRNGLCMWYLIPHPQLSSGADGFKVKQKIWDWNSSLKKVVLKGPTLMCYHIGDVQPKQRAEHAKWLSENFNYAWRKVDKEPVISLEVCT
jgi:hypothetical protein